MKSFFFLILLFSQTALSADVIELSVKGILNNGTLRYIERGIAEAEKQNAKLLLITLDTPGGVLQSTKSMVQVMNASKVPVAVYVSPVGASATSAGTILTMSAHIAAMAPGTNIGAAHPVGSQGEDIKGTMNEKATNDTVAFLKSQALLHGRNTEWAEESIRKSASITADEAMKLHVIDVVAASKEKLLWQITDLPFSKERHLNLNEAKINTLEMTLGERVLTFLGDPNVSYVLMALGGLGIYVELSSPGVVLPGVVGAICLVLAFISFSTLPVNMGAVALLLLGMIFFVAEIFIPSYGALTLGAVVSLVIGGVFLLDSSTGDLKLSLSILIPTVASFACIAGFIAWNLMKTKASMLKFNDPVIDKTARIDRLNSDGRSGKCVLKGELWDFAQDEADSTVLRVQDEVVIKAREKFLLKVRIQNS